MNWKQRRDIEKRLRGIAHVQACEKETCAMCSRMLTSEKLIATGRDLRRLLETHDALASELKERKEAAKQVPTEHTKESMRERASAFVAEMSRVFDDRAAIQQLEYMLRWFWRSKP